ncbi:MAG: methyltransferase domain-containing protein [bacterium]
MDERYQRGDTPWDLGGPSPVVQRLARDLLTPGMRVLVPGCGRGHDVEALARAGLQVTGLDLSPTALALAAAWWACRRGRVALRRSRWRCLRIGRRPTMP